MLQRWESFLNILILSRIDFYELTIRDVNVNIKERCIGIVGFPGLYGGAEVELDYQMTLWKEMGYELHLEQASN